MNPVTHYISCVFFFNSIFPIQTLNQMKGAAVSSISFTRNVTKIKDKQQKSLREKKHLLCS